jgi:putative MATE family efflux protein
VGYVLPLLYMELFVTISTVNQEVERQEDKHAPKLARDLTSGSIPRHLLAFATPMLFINVLQSAYSLINAAWVGHGLGKDALATVTDSMPAVFVLNALAMGMTMATNILVAQYAGARDWYRLQRVVQTSIVGIGVLTLVLLGVGLGAARELLILMQTPIEVRAAATVYLRIFLCSMPLMFGFFLVSSMLRGIGDAKTPVYFQLLSLFLNAVLDPVLMFGWGVPRFGLNGTAYATIIAQAVGFSGLVIYTARHRPIVMPHWRKLGVDWLTARKLIIMGLPVSLQHTVLSISMMLLMSFVNAFGTSVVAAFGGGLRIDNVAFMPALAFGAAVSSLAGQNIGARQPERVQQVFRWGIIMSGGITLVIAIVVFIIPRLLLKGFIESRETEVLNIGAGYLRIMAGTYVLYSVLFVGNGVINGAGQTMWTTLFTVITMLGARLPLAWYLPKLTHSVTGIWWAMLASVGVGALLSTGYYFSGRWKKGSNTNKRDARTRHYEG